ncbi:DUF2795 domain-containing protein [Methanosarcina horonobensis]|uniref:DUF2795 domain-containing protein n=1 Tax=Methanosarcina horonobensis TaxID=418008 RepID=UPI0022B8D5CF|nr:DUF2795 domain-containing protein [Methanosarcina horonobensis]
MIGSSLDTRIKLQNPSKSRMLIEIAPAARQAFRDMLFPAPKEALINKASESDIRSDVIQALSYIPNRQYLNIGDASAK